MDKARKKQWEDRHAKIRHRHELKRRYKYDEKYYEPRGTSYHPYGSPEYYQSETAKKKLQYRLSKEKYKKLEAPENFSIFDNPEESLSFFYDIETRVEFGHPVYFEMSNIENLSIDTVMYFLALLKRIKSSRVAYGFKGSVPSNTDCRHLLESSGFLRYVNSGRTKKDFTHESQVLQITNGQKADDSIAKRICDFAMSKLSLKRVDIKKLYVMLIELMTNTKHHAYGTDGGRKFPFTDWYVFVRYVIEKETVRFIFLDTGRGIPFTVKRKGFEPARELLGLGPKHTEYIESALKGELRSRTGESFRGKGLPKIHSYFTQRHINNLTIISNRGYFAETRNWDMEEQLKGTLFYWELSKGP
jgi:anti-sigma regulatory factor (Ser/Thr protein kinase)